MSLGVWETRQEIVTILKATTSLTGQLASGVDSVFDSRSPNEPFADDELPAVVVDSPQDTWQPTSALAPTYNGKHNFVVEVHVGSPSTDAAALAKTRDQLTDLCVEAILGNCDLWDSFEKAGSVTISRSTSIQGMRRAGAQVLLQLEATQEIAFDYGTPADLDEIHVRLDMIDPEQGDDTPETTATFEVS